MVDVSPKDPTFRRAVARGRVYMQPETTALVGEVAPGDWLLVFLGDAREVIDAARAGDASAAAVIDELAVYLGTAVANIVTVLDPAPRPLAALLPGGPLHERLRGRRVALVLSGGNVDVDALPVMPPGP